MPGSETTWTDGSVAVLLVGVYPLLLNWLHEKPAYHHYVVEAVCVVELEKREVC